VSAVVLPLKHMWPLMQDGGAEGCSGEKGVLDPDLDSRAGGSSLGKV